MTGQGRCQRPGRDDLNRRVLPFFYYAASDQRQSAIDLLYYFPSGYGSICEYQRRGPRNGGGRYVKAIHTNSVEDVVESK